MPILIQKGTCIQITKYGTLALYQLMNEKTNDFVVLDLINFLLQIYIMTLIRAV